MPSPYLAVAEQAWRNGSGLSFLGYVHLAGDFMAFCFCVGLAMAIHWGRLKMSVTLPPIDQWILYSVKSFFVLQGTVAALDFGLLLWPDHPTWVAVEVFIKLAISLAAGLTFALVIHELPRLRAVHAGLYMRHLAEEMKKRAE